MNETLVPIVIGVGLLALVGGFLVYLTRLARKIEKREK